MTDTEDWFETRARLNHDILKNRIMVAFSSRLHGRKVQGYLDPYLRLFIAQEKEFRTLIKDGARALQPGSWLTDWMESSLSVEGANILSEFLNMDFEKTSSLTGRFQETEHMLELAIAAARNTLEMPIDNDLDNIAAELEMLIDALSNALTNLPSTMLEVVESMR